MIKTIIEKLSHKEDLSLDESEACITAFFSGSCPIDDIKSILHLLSEKGESVAELVGFAKIMRTHMVPVTLDKKAIDLCGTGGSQKDRFNASTAAAFLLSAASIPVAKHGNRGSKKPNGSFDFLEALHIPFDQSVDGIQSLFQQTNLCFLFARNHHPAMKHVVQARKELGHRSIFNLLGPLCNPASVPYQVIGCISKESGKKLAEALQTLNTERSIIVVGAHGLDELSTHGTSTLITVSKDSIKEESFDPQTLDITASETDIGGSDAATNAKLFESLLKEGNSQHPISQFTALNAGLAAYTTKHVASIKEGYQLMLEVLQTGNAYTQLQTYRTHSQA